MQDKVHGQRDRRAVGANHLRTDVRDTGSGSAGQLARTAVGADVSAAGPALARTAVGAEVSRQWERTCQPQGHRQRRNA